MPSVVTEVKLEKQKLLRVFCHSYSTIATQWENGTKVNRELESGQQQRVRKLRQSRGNSFDNRKLTEEKMDAGRSAGDVVERAENGSTHGARGLLTSSQEKMNWRNKNRY